MFLLFPSLWATLMKQEKRVLYNTSQLITILIKLLRPTLSIDVWKHTYFQKYRIKFSIYVRAFEDGSSQEMWRFGGTVLVHVSLTTVTRVRFRLHVVIRLKLPWSHVWSALTSLKMFKITYTATIKHEGWKFDDGFCDYSVYSRNYGTI